MKKISKNLLIKSLLVLLLFAFASNAYSQENNNIFIGKWKIVGNLYELVDDGRGDDGEDTAWGKNIDIPFEFTITSTNPLKISFYNDEEKNINESFNKVENINDKIQGIITCRTSYRYEGEIRTSYYEGDKEYHHFTIQAYSNNMLIMTINASTGLKIIIYTKKNIIDFVKKVGNKPKKQL